MSFDQPLPNALSPSRLQDFRACPRRFQYAAIERIAQPATYAATKGRLVHAVFERLHRLDPAQRTIDAARDLLGPAEADVLTESVREDLGLDETSSERLRREATAIIDVYFTMEDPRSVIHEGVELRVRVDLDGVPMLGILDRLDREANGSLAIIDYKTGSLPNRRFDTQTFANTELYAALCEASLGERPSTIRLLYVAQGKAIERSVTPVVIRARASAARDAWRTIQRYHEDGKFPATPSLHTCRFCAFAERCRQSGVPVPTRPGSAGEAVSTVEA